MKFPRVAPRRGRVNTYALVVGAGLALLAVGLVVPFVVASPDESVSNASALGDGLDASPASDEGVTGEDRSGGGVAPGEHASSAVDASGSPAATSVASGPGSPVATTPVPRRSLTATDRGVTATEIRVGYLQTDFGGASRLGVGTGDADPDADTAAMRLWVEEINAHGGVLGRKLRLTVARWDRVTGGASGARSACLQLVKDSQSFIVLESGTGSVQAIHSCISEEHDTVMLSRNTQMTAQGLQLAGGRLLTTHMSVDRQWDAAARLAHQDGLLGKRKIGVVTSEYPVENAGATRGLIPRLEALGYSVAHQTTLSGDIGTAQSQMSVEVTQMRTKGVELVFLVTNVFYAQLWAQQGDAQGFRPLYGNGDMGAVANDTTLQNMPESYTAFAYSAAAAAANENVGRPRPQARVEADCLRRYEAFTGKRLAAGSHDVERVRQVNACSMLTFFRDTAGAVGPNLTDEALMARITSTGDVSTWWAEPPAIRFGPGKFDAADALRRVVTTRVCPEDDDRNGCWVPDGDFRRIG